MKNEVNAEFWNERWIKKETAWDMGSISPPLKNYFDQLENKNLKTLIPGCGNAYEAEYLFRNGFKNVFIVDYAKAALDEFQKRVPDFPKENLFCLDFFQLEENNFDLIVEQTFFCAIDPKLRNNYAKKMLELLSSNGKLVGLLFNDPKLNLESPPFRGSEEEYRGIFGNYFEIKKMETCYNSISPRAGRELFILLQKHKS